MEFSNLISITDILIIIILIITAYYQQKTTKQTKQKATISYLQQLSTVDKFVIAIENFKTNLDYSEGSISKLSDKDLDIIVEEEKDIGTKTAYLNHKKQEIVLLLNFFESLAIGESVGIYDLEIIKLSRKQQTIHTFELSKKYIYDLRKEFNNDNLFINLENLSKKLSYTNAK